MVAETSGLCGCKIEADHSIDSVVQLRTEHASNLKNTWTIYDKPARGDQPDDLARSAAVDAAYRYLQDLKLDKNLGRADLEKVIFLAGIFIGMSLMYGLFEYLEML